MPARLADGLEAKKSSSEVSDTPHAFIQNKSLGSPALFIKQLRQLIFNNFRESSRKRQDFFLRSEFLTKTVDL
jgi:hypothetical protein